MRNLQNRSHLAGSLALWKPIQNFLWQWRGVLITAPSVTAVLLAGRLLGWLQPIELALLDQFFRLRPPEPRDQRILIVGVDETDLQKLEKWPTSDVILAKALDKIRQQKPAAIGLDLYRDFPVEPGYKSLVKIFKTTPNLIGIEKKVGAGSGAAVKAPPVLEELGQIGVNDVFLDADGRQRRGLLVLQDNSPSLALQLAFLYLEQHGILPEQNPGNDFLKLKNTVFTPFEKNDGGYIHADAGGYQILLNYRGGARSFDTVSLSDILEHKVKPERIKNRIILIGVTAASVNDRFLTPLSGGFTSSPDYTSGVEIHANLTSQIISTVLDNRTSIHTWADPWEWTWTLGWATIGAVISWQWRYAKTGKQRIPGKAITTCLAGTIAIGSCYGAFLLGWWLPIAPALMALTGSSLVITTYVARSASDIRKTFGRYLTDEVVNSLLETPAGLQMGGERRQVTILMSDLRGFSAASEQQPPEQVLSFLNLYLEIMTDVITQYQGTIDEFLGDAILVMFGAPTQRPDDAERAVACAVAMQLAMEEVNQHKNLLGLDSVEMGIGINTGEVVVGNIGSVKRSKYGIVGSQINLTSRIESYTVGGQILISDATKAAIGDSLQLGGSLQVHAKGFQQAICLHEVRGMGGKYDLRLPDLLETQISLDPPIAVTLTVLDGKHLSDETWTAHLIKLGDRSAELYTSARLEPLTNLKLNLQTADSADFYAKVQSIEDSDRMKVRFTFIPADVKKSLTSALATAPTS